MTDQNRGPAPQTDPETDPRTGRARLEAATARLAETNPAAAARLAGWPAHPELGPVLDRILAASPHLLALIEAEPALAAAWPDSDPQALFEAECAAARAAAAAADEAALMAALRRARRRAWLIAALADLTGRWPLETLTARLSAFADAAMGAVLGFLLVEAHERGRLTLPDPGGDPLAGSGLVVLALGKWGARELNYSSDIDFAVFYEPEGVACPDPAELGRLYVRLVGRLVRILETRTGAGFVFRTDLRLRPDPGATPLAVSVAAAESYYGGLAQNWERAAMIKARAVAADPPAARALMAILTPWLWRRSLDFAAIEDIHAIKRQIQAGRAPWPTDLAGHDLKTGRGGIREIELFVQVQQLIWGGRDVRLRVPGTLDALDRLAATGRLTAAARDELAAAYRRLRETEHRLQMIADRQTHSLPADRAGMARLARLAGLDSARALTDELAARMRRVEARYAALFEDSPSLAEPGNLVFTGSDDDPDTLATLARMGFAEPAQVAERVRIWHRGRLRATRARRARELLTELVPELLARLAAGPQPDRALARFDAFLAAQPAGVSLFAMLRERPALIALIADIMGSAPGVAARLSRRPALLEAVTDPDFHAELPNPDAARAALRADLDLMLAGARDLEDRLDIARRFAAEAEFRAAVHLLTGEAEIAAVGGYLTAAAEAVCARLLDAVEAEFAAAHGRFATEPRRAAAPPRQMTVLALGKFGAGELAFGSDLDLVLAYDIPAGRGGDETEKIAAESDGARPLAASVYFARLAQRLVRALTAPTAQGRLYEVDLRLRPSGSDGPLAASLDRLRAYYRGGEAWVWELMALTRARPVAGPAPVAEAIAALRREILACPRDPAGLRAEVSAMRRRLAAQFPGRGRWDLKHRPGGLVDIEFLVQFLQLAHGADRPEILVPGTAEALPALARAAILDADAAQRLIATHELWRTAQAFVRLMDVADPDMAEPATRQRLARALAPRAGLAPEAGFEALTAALEARARHAAGLCRAHLDAAG